MTSMQSLTTHKYFLFLKPKFILTNLIALMFSTMIIRQYQKFVYDFDTNSTGLGLEFADYFFRFQITIILLIPFLLTWYWLNKEDEIQNIQNGIFSHRIKTKFNVGIPLIFYFTLGYFLYNFGNEGL